MKMHTGDEAQLTVINADDLAEAFAGWRNSPDHNKNMLRPDMTMMGIAAASAAGSKYGIYWSLVLAHPYEGRAGFLSGQ